MARESCEYGDSRACGFVKRIGKEKAANTGSILVSATKYFAIINLQKWCTKLGAEARPHGVIRCVDEILLRSEVSLGRLYRSVAEQHLDLF